MPDNKTILLVEDEAIIAMGEIYQLEQEGYTVRHALTGPDAIQMIRDNNENIDLILMDIDLGRGMDGTEAAMEILKDHDIPILFLTSHTEKEVIDKTEKITSYGFAVKNVGTAMLAASIRMAFRLHSANKNIAQKHHELESTNDKLKAAIEEIVDSKKMLQEKSDEMEKKIIQSNLAQRAGRIGSYDIDIVRREGSWSDGFSDIYGVQPGESNLTFQNLKSSVMPEDLHIVQDFYKRAISAGEATSMAYRIKRDDTGEICWIETRARVTYDEEQKPVRMIGIIMDITKHKNSEEALRKSEEMYRFLFNNVPVAIGIADTKGHAIDHNKSFEEILGSSINETKGRFVASIYQNPDDRDTLLSILQKEGKLRNHEVSFKRKDGSVFHALLNIDIASMQGQSFNLVTMRDITDKKNAEEMLKNSETRYQALVENSLVGIGIACGNHIRYANRALMDIYGFDDFNEFSSKPLIEYLTPESKAFVDNWRKKRDAGETVLPEFELDIIRKDGQKRNLRLISTTIIENDEMLDYTTFIDITDKKTKR